MFSTCTMCEGEGGFVVKTLNLFLTCEACKGKKGFEIPEGKTLCNSCNGAGKIFNKTIYGIMSIRHCYKCDGKGLI